MGVGGKKGWGGKKVGKKSAGGGGRPARDRPFQTGKGVTAPLDPDSVATTTTIGPTARRIVLYPKGTYKNRQTILQ